MSVHTNNGVERKNKDFNHQYLAQFKDKSLSGMITVPTEQFLPDKEKRLVALLYLFVTSFKITHHHWPTTKQWMYISKGIKHFTLIRLHLAGINFLSFLVFEKSRQIMSC